ncbi:MAG: hypothetical protein JNJ90_00775 [Saprospiraceae bacterium]|jgi:hypothetical protein|nr:hypothetical protein [Saprospiraceae bacterium]
MSNNSINPMFISALDILTGALGVFIILNFLNTRMSTNNPPPKPEPVAAKVEKPVKPEVKKPQRREYAPAKPKPAQPVKPTQPAQPVKPAQPAKPDPTPAPVAQQPPTPPQDPVAVDLMKQTKGDVTLLLQQEGLAKQTVEFMLRQGNQTWKPSRASKYQNDEFQYEKNLNYFYQASILPGTYEVLVRIKRRSNATTAQPFSLFGKIIQPGYKSITHNFGTYALSGSDDWVRAGTFTVLSNTISYKSALPPATAISPTDEQQNVPVQAPKPEPKKVGKWGR